MTTVPHYISYGQDKDGINHCSWGIKYSMEMEDGKSMIWWDHLILNTKQRKTRYWKKFLFDWDADIKQIIKQPNGCKKYIWKPTIMNTTDIVKIMDN
ncbi:MAG: hypothetical protein GY928_12630 [Colwellia sp.]|nr:hypothetical protein [Colwellia sp.]